MKNPDDDFDIQHFTYTGDARDEPLKRKCLSIKAGRRGVQRIVPPLSEPFDIPKWERSVEIYWSPAGKNIRVYVDGEEVVKP